jgi:hypothetical protein
MQIALWSTGVAVYVKSTKNTDSQHTALAATFMDVEYHAFYPGVNQ